ncbi:unnamed protein product [Blepharisma stoltei]|uniref:Protein kinase domain-containing protein n=1 Tax=Blepharisma stoltei TaxID=1481888 RepID=A0AAU9IXX4_9CILI|nr:unnamed protein product [Blepharisma stoltei]
MGTACCTNRSSVRVADVQNIPQHPKENRSIDSNQHELLRRQKSQLFQSEGADSTFIEISTPRTGKLIKWKRGDLIGEGAYAKVYQCLNIETGELFAVKHFTLSDDIKKIEREFYNMKKEVSLLRDLNHKNIIKYYQTELSEDLNCIDVMLEYIPGGSLKQILQKYHHLEETIIKSYGKQLLEGLGYLHANGIVHRDLKSANVLISTKGVVKLTDFGSSKKFEDLDEQLSKSLKGSPYWMAPEVVRREGHTFSADIWSFGCLLIEMFNGSPPWSNYSRNAKEVLRMISAPDNFPDIPEQCSNSLHDLICKCLKRNPLARPTAKEILNHEFFVTDENLHDNSSTGLIG